MKKQSKLKKFLLKHRVYRKFVANLDECNTFEEFEKAMKDEKVNESDFIVRAFWWDDSNEGFEFWRNISHEWVYYIKNKRD